MLSVASINISSHFDESQSVVDSTPPASPSTCSRGLEDDEVRRLSASYLAAQSEYLQMLQLLNSMELTAAKSGTSNQALSSMHIASMRLRVKVCEAEFHSAELKLMEAALKK